MKMLLIIGAIVLGGYALINTSSNDKSEESTVSETPSTLVDVVRSESACYFTGVSDVYTGDGRVLFTFTLENSGDAGDVSVTPVRHYSDGGINESAMDMMTFPVGGYTTELFRSEQLTYEAHAHEIVSCGLRIDGGTEIPIKAKHV